MTHHRETGDMDMTELYDIVKAHKGPILIETLPHGGKSMQVKVIKTDLLHMMRVCGVTEDKFSHVRIFDQLILLQRIY
jgi:hypothetical protein